MMNKENYENLSGFIFECNLRIGNDGHHALKEIIRASIIYFIDSHPKYTIDQILHIVGWILKDEAQILKTNLEHAYPKANSKTKNRVDINKLFVMPIMKN